MDSLLEETIITKEKKQKDIYEEIERKNKHIIEVLNNIGQNTKKDDLIFLYGPTGSGKSYLIKRMKTNLRKKLILQLRVGMIEDLVKNEKEYDLLILDHIEFILCKEQSRIILKKMIEQLLEKGKKIILISDWNIKTENIKYIGELGRWIIEQRNFFRNG